MDENKTQTNNKEMKVLRTYSSDMAEAVRTNEMTVIKIALAEKEKREREALYKKAEGTNTGKLFLVIGGIVLIAGAIFISYFFMQKKEAGVTPQATMSNIETFISYDSKLLIDTTEIEDVNELFNLVKKELTGMGMIQSFFFTKKTSAESTPTLLTTKNFLSLLQTTAPESLIRSLTDKYLFGKYSNGKIINENNKQAFFLIFQTTDYNLAYASMLSWEKTLLKDLYTMFGIEISRDDTAIFEKQWKDIVINNKDARVLYGNNGEEILYYVFVNKNNFVITNSIEALKEVISRLIIKDAKPS